MALIIFGGLGFAILAEILHRQKRKKFSLSAIIVLKVSFFLLILGMIVITAVEWNNPETLGHLNTGERVMAGGFLSTTARTAGFNTIDTSLWQRSTILFVLFLMFIGASPGSTGGGIKTTTFAIIVISIRSFVSGRRDMEIWDWRISVNYPRL